MADDPMKKVQTQVRHKASTTWTVTKVNDTIAARTIYEAKLLQEKLILEKA